MFGFFNLIIRTFGVIFGQETDDLSSRRPRAVEILSKSPKVNEKNTQARSLRHAIFHPLGQDGVDGNRVGHRISFR